MVGGTPERAYRGAMHAWVNGAIVDPGQAQLPVDDHGLIVGDGIFETMKSVRREPFAITRHLRRMGSGLEALGIPHPGEGLLRGAVHECLAAYDDDAEARIRLTVTAGGGSLGSGAPDGPPSVFVVVSPAGGPVPPAAITVPWTRNEGGALAGLKTTSYAENVRALRAAHDVGASEAIFPNTRDELCEGTGTNVFVVVDGECLTPPLSSGCLAGVTRELVLELGLAREATLPISVLEDADEIFLTSTTRDVQGLERVDDRALPVGPVTRHVAERFDAVIAETTDP